MGTWQHRIWAVHLYSREGLRRLDALADKRNGDTEVCLVSTPVQGENGHLHVFVKRSYLYERQRPSDADEFVGRILHAVGRARVMISPVEIWTEDE